MSIRVRLLLSYIAMLVIPLVLSVIAAVVLLASSVGSLKKAHLGPDFVRELTHKAFQVEADMESITANDPDRLKDIKYLSQLDKELSIINTGILVNSDKGLIYASKFLNDARYAAKLASIQFRTNHFETMMMDDRPYIIKYYGFAFKDQSKGSVYIVTDVSMVGQFAGNYFRSLVWTIILIIVFTNGILTFIVSRKIVRPLGYLKHAALQIKSGNLNFPVRTHLKDEIGQLCHAFEEMRCKLKESIELQLQYEDNRKELISSISHDLKTPVTAIKGYVEGIMDGVADTPEKMDKYLKTIYRKTIDMDKLIDELFLFSKLDLKKVPFNFEKVDITEFLQDCADEAGFEHDGKGISLSFASSLSEAVLVSADREKLKRVTTNIIENAMKYMDKEKGKIDIMLKDGKDWVEVQIHDNGCGISQEELPFIFDRFYRADPSRNTSTGGSGLGLTIAKRIVEEHSGKIWAQSREGEGTSIYFTLRKVR